MYIAGPPAVACESRDVYCWFAHCRMQVQGCISLVRPLLSASTGMYIVGAPIIECEFSDVYRYCAHCKISAWVCISLVCPLYDVSPRM